MICVYCNINIATQRHHKFSKTRITKRLYPDYIDDPRNIDPACEPCHLWKPITRWSEKKFCSVMKIEIRSKSGLL